MGKKLNLKKNKRELAKKQAAKQAEKQTLNFGLSDKSHLIKKAKTHKGRKFLEKKGP